MLLCVCVPVSQKNLRRGGVPGQAPDEVQDQELTEEVLGPSAPAAGENGKALEQKLEETKVVSAAEQGGAPSEAGAATSPLTTVPTPLLLLLPPLLKRSSPSKCVPSTPSAVPNNIPSSFPLQSVTVDGVTYTLELGPGGLMECIAAELLIRTSPPLPDVRIDTDAVGVEVTAHFYTKGEGIAWSPGEPAPVTLSRRLPLRQRRSGSGEGSLLVAKIVPDATAVFYAFSLEVCPLFVCN